MMDQNSVFQDVSQTINPFRDNETTFIEKVQDSFQKMTPKGDNQLDFFTRMAVDVNRRKHKQSAVQEASSFYRSKKEKSLSWVEQEHLNERLYRPDRKATLSQSMYSMNTHFKSNTSGRKKITKTKVKDFIEKHKKKDQKREAKIMEEQKLREIAKEIEFINMKKSNIHFGKKREGNQFLERMNKDSKRRKNENLKKALQKKKREEDSIEGLFKPDLTKGR